MNTYNVHIYREMRLYFPSITAHTLEEAARIAAEKPTEDAAYTDECDGETFGALVDVVGDEEYRHSRMIDFDTDRTAAPAMLKALEIVITNDHHLLEEKMTPQDAAAIRSAFEQGHKAGVSPTSAQEGGAGHCAPTSLACRKVMSKVTVVIEGGIVQAAYCNDQNTRLVVLDRDIEGADPDDSRIYAGHAWVQEHEVTGYEYMPENDQRAQQAFLAPEETLPVFGNKIEDDKGG